MAPLQTSVNSSCELPFVTLVGCVLFWGLHGMDEIHQLRTHFSYLLVGILFQMFG